MKNYRKSNFVHKRNTCLLNTCLSAVFQFHLTLRDIYTVVIVCSYLVKDSCVCRVLMTVLDVMRYGWAYLINFFVLPSTHTIYLIWYNFHISYGKALPSLYISVRMVERFAGTHLVRLIELTWSFVNSSHRTYSCNVVVIFSEDGPKKRSKRKE